MHTGPIILEGIISTLFMTGFVYSAAFLLRRRLYVIAILGTMLTNQTTDIGGLSTHATARFIGMLAHFAVGIVFAALFEWLAQTGLLPPDLLYVLLFGVLCGGFAVIVWWLFFQWHPHPPDVPLTVYLPVIFTGHTVFALGVYWLHKSVIPLLGNQTL